MNPAAPAPIRSRLASPPWFRTLAIVSLVVFGVFRAYRHEPGHPQIADSKYSLLLTESLLTTGSSNLDRYAGAAPYQLTQLKNDPERHWRYGYPIGSSLLSLPLVAYQRERSMREENPRWSDSDVREAELQQRIAALVSAVTVGLFVLIGRRIGLGWPGCLGVALAFAFGSPLWSTASRGLWSHTWAVLLLTAAIAIIARWEMSPSAPSHRSGFGLGILLVVLLLVRPQEFTAVGAIGWYLLLAQRSALVPVAFGSILSFAAISTACSRVYDQPMPPSIYSSNVFNVHNLSARVYGLFLAPSRGLLLFCPWLIAIAYGLLRYRAALPAPRLAVLALGGVSLHTAMLIAYEGCNGGSSYGPRYFTDILPWFAVLALLATAAETNTPRTALRNVLEGLAVVLLCAAAFWLHWRGATDPECWLWNHRIARDDRAIFDWRQPQFLAGITHVVPPDGEPRPLP